MKITFRKLSLAAFFTLSVATVQAQRWGDLLNKVLDTSTNNNRNNNQNNNGGNQNNNGYNQNNNNNRNNNNSNGGYNTNNRNNGGYNDNRGNNSNGNNADNGSNNSYNNNANSNNTNNGGGRNGGFPAGGVNLGAGLGNSDIVSGLKEALSIGARNAGARLNITNGFFGNSLIKILMPPEAAKVESALRQVGMGKLVDDAVLSMNRAAEDAAGKAAPIFINAVTSMNIQDGLNILKGGNGAATEFLRQKTTMALTEAFRPVIQNALNKSGATNMWSKVFGAYNKLPMTRQKINPDLVAYATERALSGLFVTIADEEAKIRTNPAARVTSILQKVFGG